MAGTINVSRTSRYKDTAIYGDPDVGPVFALFEAPVELAKPRADERTHIVKRGDVGMLDHLAVRYWGPTYEQYWWVIGLANRIIDPDRDMYVGQSLRIPSRSTVLEFASRIGNG